MRRVKKEFDPDSYVNSPESIGIYKELNERIDMGNLQQSRMDPHLALLLKKAGDRSRAAQSVIASAVPTWDVQKIITTIENNQDVIPPLYIKLGKEIIREEYSNTEMRSQMLRKLSALSLEANTHDTTSDTTREDNLSPIAEIDTNSPKVTQTESVQAVPEQELAATHTNTPKNQTSQR